MSHHARILTLALAVLLLAACDPAAELDHSATFEQTVALEPDGQFRLENFNGTVRVEAWDEPQVEIQALRRASSQRALDEIEVEIRGEGDSVRVKTVLPHSRWWFGAAGAVVDYQVKVPRSARLRLETINGNLTVESVSGSIRAKSVNGGVRIKDAAAGVDASTVNGPVRVSYAVLPGGDRHKFTTVNGQVSLRLPSGAAAEFDIRTVNGAVDTDLPLRIQGSQWGGPKSARGVIGDREEADIFRVNTVNGAVTIDDGDGAWQEDEDGEEDEWEEPDAEV